MDMFWIHPWFLEGWVYFNSFLMTFRAYHSNVSLLNGIMLITRALNSSTFLVGKKWDLSLSEKIMDYLSKVFKVIKS